MKKLWNFIWSRQEFINKIIGSNEGNNKQHVVAGVLALIALPLFIISFPIFTGPMVSFILCMIGYIFLTTSNWISGNYNSVFSPSISRIFFSITLGLLVLRIITFVIL